MYNVLHNVEYFLDICYFITIILLQKLGQIYFAQRLNNVTFADLVHPTDVEQHVPDVTAMF